MQVDLTALGEQIKAAAESAKANDPAALKARGCARLEKELASRPASTPDSPSQVPVLTAAEAKLLERACATVEKLVRIIEQVKPLLGKLGAAPRLDAAGGVPKPQRSRPCKALR